MMTSLSAGIPTETMEGSRDQIPSEAAAAQHVLGAKAVNMARDPAPSS